MTEWHINDLSLSGQFRASADFCNVLRELLKLRARNETIRTQLYCSRQLATRLVTHNLDVRSAILQQADKGLTAQVLAWLNKAGPFSDDGRDVDDLSKFTFAGHDVTDQGLGEAARRREREVDAQTFSFDGATPSCSTTPLAVDQQPASEALQTVLVPNFWDIATLEQAVQSALAPPRNWDDAVARLRADFDKVIIAEWVEDVLRPHPFNMNVYNRSRELLGVLQKFVESHTPDGLRTTESQKIIALHFSGQKAWFSDSSETEKNDFKDKLTFRDPLRDDIKIFCAWHGKIKTPQYRIHFEWPLQQTDRVVKVVYIGPKLTK